MSDESLKARFEYDNGTLKNKLGERDPEHLRFIEYRTVIDKSEYLVQHPFKIDSVNDLTKIHKFIFGPIYEWAGEIRDFELSKNGIMFMFSPAIPTGIENINEQLKQINAKNTPTQEDYAYLLDAVNYLHPFREGNGRSTKLFIQILALNHGQELYFDRQDPQMIQALNNADVNEIANFITIKHVGNQAQIINHLTKERQNKQVHYRTFKPNHKKQRR